MMLGELNAILAGQSRAVIIATSLALTGVLGLLDHLTGFEVSFSIFYLIPIMLVAWYASRAAGLAIAIVAAAVWMGVDLSAGHQYTHIFIPAWNALVRCGFFVVIVSLLTNLKAHLANESKLARNDSLTGVLNGRAFRELIRRDFELARRYKNPASLLYLDVDDFKRINDTCGHSEGDQVLRAVARCLSETVRGSDLVARMGGDEFAVFFPLTDYPNAGTVIGKLVESLAGVRRGDGTPISVSVGAVSFLEMPATVDEAIAIADSLMYQVKNGGKNDVCHLLWPIRDLPEEHADTQVQE